MRDSTKVREITEWERRAEGVQRNRESSEEGQDWTENFRKGMPLKEGAMNAP